MESATIGLFFMDKCKWLPDFLDELNTWSVPIMMGLAYGLAHRSAAVNRVESIMLVVMLSTGRYWNFAGAGISMISACLLVAQYICSFQFVDVWEEEWLGLDW